MSQSIEQKPNETVREGAAEVVDAVKQTGEEIKNTVAATAPQAKKGFGKIVEGIATSTRGIRTYFSENGDSVACAGAGAILTSLAIKDGMELYRDGKKRTAFNYVKTAGEAIFGVAALLYGANGIRTYRSSSPAAKP